MTPEQLKASILQRAMEGKLVPQDPNDEPASELLKRIKAEKEKLIKEGKIKRDKNETEIFRGDDGLHYEKFQDGSIKQVDVPFEIPESWEWVYLGQVGTLQRGAGIKKSETVSKGIQCVRYGEIYTTYDYFFTETVSSTTSDVAKRSVAVDADDILITLTGENKKDIGKAVAYLGNASCVMGGDLSKLSNHKMNAKYLSFILNSPNVRAQKSELATGNIIVHISNSKLEKILVPIPPIKEQQEIVDKVEYYFSFVDEYKIAQNKLTKINDEFPEKLRKSILQYAMQGKLVPQDATDEPVEVLLEKIREEKQRLFEEGKLQKKDLQESIIYQGDDNSYYEKKSKELLQLETIPSIPLTWKYLRFNQIVNYYMGKTPPRSISTYWGNDIPWVSIADMVSNGVIYSTKEALSNTFKANIQEKISPPNTLLMSFKLTVGKVSLLGIEAAHNEAIISIFPYADTNEIMKMYLFKFLPEIVKYGDSKDAIKGKTLNSKSINALLIPLPPLEEQKRIVDKIDKLDLSVAKLNCIQNNN